MKSKHRQLALVSTAIFAGVLALSQLPSAASKTTTQDPSQLVPLGQGFADGFRAGYQKANPMAICPIPPFPPFGSNSYEDGFGLGYAQGMIDRQ